MAKNYTPVDKNSREYLRTRYFRVLKTLRLDLNRIFRIWLLL